MTSCYLGELLTRRVVTRRVVTRRVVTRRVVIRRVVTEPNFDVQIIKNIINNIVKGCP